MLLSLLGAGIHVVWAWRWDRVSMGAETTCDATPVPNRGVSCDVVTCFHNEEAHVAGYASAIRPVLDEAESRGMRVRLVAVNHGSTDRTRELLESEADRDPRWAVLDVPRTRPGKKEALAAGIGAGTSDVVALLDADCRPLDRRWLAVVTEGAGDVWDVLVGIGFPESGPQANRGLLGRLQRLEARRLAHQAAGAVRAKKPFLAFGRNLAFTRATWDHVGGFKSHAHVLSGDDDLWLQEAASSGARVATKLDPCAQTASSWPTSWTAWRRQKSRHFTASSAYPRPLQLRLALPTLATLLLTMGVVHNPSGTSVGLAALSLMARTLTFGLFLHHAGQPWREAWELVMDPAVSAFRGWAWWKGATSESTTWK
jgi:cellulose synthase/poly-beta-1,6-N-acetylglucosamine synthase-like glycosyltransferase